MRKIFFAMLIAYIDHSYAQQTNNPKIFNHYIGIQANEVLRQLINLNESNTVIDNPYLITYGGFYNKLNVGLQAAFGFNYSKTHDKFSPTSPESKVSNSFYRIGIARNFFLGKKWEATAGLDYAGSYQLNKTGTIEVIEVTTVRTDSTASFSSSTIKTNGGGAQLRIGFHLSEYIMLSTEATFYYFVSAEKNNVILYETVTDTQFPQNDSYTISSINEDIDNSSFDITVPVAIFLTVKF